MSLVDRLAGALDGRISRRGFLTKAAMAATAVAVAPGRFLLEPHSAYATATRGWCDSRCSQYSPYTCDCGDLCCQGWTEFCCATHPATGNTCPPGTIPAGWWRADGSGLCDVNGQTMPRYYVDCNAICADGCGGSGGTCGPECHPDFPCGCAQNDCAHRKSSCTRFRYGQCNSDVAYVGAVVCRYVSCTPPWEWSADCAPSPVLWSNATASHDRPCLHEGTPGGAAPGIVRLAGSDRFATAAAVAQSTHPDGAGMVFVATGLTFPDALASGPTAARRAAPVLLVHRESVPSVTAAELTRLAPADVVILGGTSAISATCAAELALYGTVTRVAGATRYETAVEISRFGFPGSAPAVVVATGEWFTDALAGAPMASAFGGPLLLTRPDSLPAAVLDEIRRLDPAAIYLVGDLAAVSPAVEAQLAAEAPVTRISGPDPYATSAQVSSTAFPGGATKVFVAVGTNFPDALAGSAAAGASDAPLVLVETNTLPATVASEITRLGPAEAVILGGPAAIADAVAQAISELIS